MQPLFRARTAFLSILAISSILASAYILVLVPLGAHSSTPIMATPIARRPLELYLPYLNAALALSIAVTGGVQVRNSSDVADGFGLLSILPGGEPR